MKVYTCRFDNNEDWDSLVWYDCNVFKTKDLAINYLNSLGYVHKDTIIAENMYDYEQLSKKEYVKREFSQAYNDFIQTNAYICELEFIE